MHAGSLCLVLLSGFVAVLAFKDLGKPGYSCAADLMRKSKSVPTSVHSLRPADIDIVGAIGDSLTAANGAGALPDDPVAVLIQYRGLTFSIGGDKSLDEHVSIANVLRKYNPALFGYSTGTGSANNWEKARLNVGIPGAHSTQMLEQAKDLVQKMRQHPEIDFNNHWKAVFIFIGGNDMCGWCDMHDGSFADEYRDHIKNAVQYLHDNLPKTIVVLTGMIDLALLRRVDQNQDFCKGLHVFECRCEQRGNVTDTDLTNESKQFMIKEQELQDTGMFDDKDDFTLIIQPFLEGLTDIGRNPDGTPDLSFFAPDCFHFSAYGHAVSGLYLWNNMMEAVGSKSTANLTDSTTALKCPDASCPFIRTTLNSKDCTKYVTP